MKHLRGAAFEEYYKQPSLFAIVIITIPLVFFLPFIADELRGASHQRPLTSRVIADLRSLATGIESYYVDHDAYPAFAVVPDRKVLGSLDKEYGDGLLLPTFAVMDRNGAPYRHLSTPVSYIPTYFIDPFVESPSSTYCYWPDPTNSGWIAWSAGPDGDFDLTYDFVETTYNPRTGDKPFYYLRYDPTNGSTSSGDIYRVKQ